MPDLVTDVGLTEILNRLTGQVAAGALYCAVGSGNATPTGAETTLETETARVIASTVTVSGNVATLKFFFTTAQANGNVGESGLFTAASVGTMIDKGTESPVKIKSSAQEMIVTKTITLNRA